MVQRDRLIAFVLILLCSVYVHDSVCVDEVSGCELWCFAKRKLETGMKDANAMLMA